MSFTYSFANEEKTVIVGHDAETGVLISFPANPANTDYQTFLASGETPAPYLAPTVVDGITDLTEAKTVAAESTRAEAHSILQPTDWVVVRQAETGVEAPAATTSYRASVRTACDNKVVTIDSEPDLESLKTYLRSGEYATWPKVA